jgi:MHS family proline/betaine transporter-like MFS transporter
VNTPPPSRALRAVLPAVAGNALEFYDFTLYAIFAAVIGRQFFPAPTAFESLLIALGVYAAGFAARPIGAMLIGGYADQRGRKAALTLTIALMAAGTALIAFTPPVATIGVTATALVLLGRLLQGLSAGAEIGVASALLFESTARDQRCFIVSWQIASQGAAALAGAVAAMLVYGCLSEAAVESWGWRVPFIAGLLIAPLGWVIRRKMVESLPRPAPRHPVRELLAGHGARLMHGVGLLLGPTVFMQVLTYYLPIHLQRTLHYPPAWSFVLAFTIGGALLITAPLIGRYADGLQYRKPLLCLALVLSTAAILPAFVLLNTTASLTWSVVLITALAVLHYSSGGAGFVLLMEAFPPHLRASSISLIYSLCVAVFGGTTLLAVTWLVDYSGDARAPAWYAGAACLLSLIALWRFPEVPADQRGR